MLESYARALHPQWQPLPLSLAQSPAGSARLLVDRHLVDIDALALTAALGDIWLNIASS